MIMRIERPKKLYCPEITIYWPGAEVKSSRSADCDPLEEGEEAEPWSGIELWPAGIWFQVPPGRWDVTVEARTSLGFARTTCRVEASE